MKIYTKTGDTGTTGLVGGQRVSKSAPRLDAYGTIDELNATLGLAAVAAEPTIQPMLRAIQNELFVIGSLLATPADSPHAASIPVLSPEAITRLEQQIDTAEAQLPPLRQFILPGGTEPAARLHLARTVCRRAERLVVSLAEDHVFSPVILTYLNRLSDWLFMHARLANHAARVVDIPWQKP